MSGPAEPPGAAEQAIRSYLAEIAAGLDGPASARRDIMSELGTGVADAADAHRCAGLEPAQAARTAIAEFGSPARVAAGFRGELAAATARRTTLTLMTVGSVTAALGCLASLASHIHQPAPPWELATLLRRTPAGHPPPRPLPSPRPSAAPCTPSLLPAASAHWLPATRPAASCWPSSPAAPPPLTWRCWPC